MYQISDKTDNFEFFGPNLPKTGFLCRNFKNLSPDSQLASLRYYVLQFLNKRDNFEFLGPNLPKNGFWSRNFKDLSLDLESTPPLCYVCQLNRLHKLLRCFRCYPCVNNCWLVRTYHSVLLTYVMPLVSFYTP